jgi:hypothetical protein
MPDPTRNNSGRWLIAVGGAAVLLAIGAAALYRYAFTGPFATDTGTWGEFGDYFGGVLNPLFGLGGFLALLYTVHLQSNELRANAESARSQLDLMQYQRFEDTYFRLLGLYNEVVQSLSISVGPSSRYSGETAHTYTGRECLRAIHERLLTDYMNKAARGDIASTALDGIEIEYKEFYDQHGHLVGHYFRTIYNAIKFVDRSHLSATEKKAYTNILRAQLSKFELGLLFYNVASTYGRDRMLPYVKQYHLLKHLEDGVLASPDDRNVLGAL